MKLLESKAFVVLQVTRGRSTVQAVFTEELHAQKFIEKVRTLNPATYIFQESTLYDFAPDEGELHDEE